MQVHAKNEMQKNKSYFAHFVLHYHMYNLCSTFVCSYNKQTADLIFIIKSNYFRIQSIGGNDKKVMIFAQCTSEVYPIFQIQCARGLTLKTDGRSLAKARPALILSAVRNSDSLSLRPRISISNSCLRLRCPTTASRRPQLIGIHTWR